MVHNLKFQQFELPWDRRRGDYGLAAFESNLERAIEFEYFETIAMSHSSVVNNG